MKQKRVERIIFPSQLRYKLTLQNPIPCPNPKRRWNHAPPVSLFPSGLRYFQDLSQTNCAFSISTFDCFEYWEHQLFETYPAGAFESKLPPFEDDSRLNVLGHWVTFLKLNLCSFCHVKALLFTRFCFILVTAMMSKL